MSLIKIMITILKQYLKFKSLKLCQIKYFWKEPILIIKKALVRKAQRLWAALSPSF